MQVQIIITNTHPDDIPGTEIREKKYSIYFWCDHKYWFYLGFSKINGMFFEIMEVRRPKEYKIIIKNW